MIFSEIYYKEKEVLNIFYQQELLLKNGIRQLIFDTIYRNSDPIKVTNIRFDLAKAYETLKHKLNIYSDEGSGWIIDKIEDIWLT